MLFNKLNLITVIFALNIQSIWAISSSNSNINKNIVSSDKLKELNLSMSEFDSKLQLTSDEIIQERANILKLEEELKKIDLDLVKDRIKYKVEFGKYENLNGEIKNLQRQQLEIKNQIGEISARLVSLAIVKNGGVGDIETVFVDEAYSVLNRETGKNLQTMRDELKARQDRINALNRAILNLGSNISQIEQKNKLIGKKKNEKETKSLDLEQKLANYKIRLQEIIDQHHKIQEEIAEATRIAEAEKERERLNSEAASNSNENYDSYNNNNRTRSLGNSYQLEKTQKYRGEKTIPPLDNYKILTRFGTYTDPIYKFKIFSSAVVMQPKGSATRVKAIFDGAVTIVKDDKTLGKFVMIEHNNGLHIIYANLDMFAPDIKAGRKIKKGSVLGRVSERLYFEVIYKNNRINPMEVIQ
jgi:septal ring factor EnvC (AmiA/AmiB activator)